jgi:hypothetical protein
VTVLCFVIQIYGGYLDLPNVVVVIYHMVGDLQ